MTTNIEPPDTTETAPPPETMRHVLPLSFVQGKIEECRDLVNRILPGGVTPASAIGTAYGTTIDERMQALSRSLLRLAEAAGSHRLQQTGGHRIHLDQAFTSALQALGRLDAERFRQRPHYTSFKRSSGEIVTAAMFVVVYELQQWIAAIQMIDPGVYEKVNEKLVKLEVTFEDAMRSIAEAGRPSV